MSNHVIHDGYANTYSLKHNDHGLTLASLPIPKYHKWNWRREV